MRVNSISTYTHQTNIQNRKNNNQSSYYNLSFKSNATRPVVNGGLKKIYQQAKNFLKVFAIIASAGLFATYTNKQWNQALEDVGYVQPLQKDFETKEDAINYAISRIVDPLNADDAYEYSVILDHNNYSVVSERKGDSNSVANYPISYIIKDFFNIKHPYISLHGHPQDMFHDKLATQTFSFQDFKVFNCDKNEKESFVINKDGKFCMLRKKENFKPLSNDELNLLKSEYEHAFHFARANPVNNYNNDSLVHTINDYQGMHSFWKSVADRYNLEYYTNYGVHEGIDAYIDYYYPELDPPLERTSHRNFKL